MAVGPTEGLSSGVMSVDSRQVAIATQTISFMTALMRGKTGGTNDPNSAIGGAGEASLRDTGLGVSLDLQG